MRRLILAIDQGTTGTACLVVDAELRVVGRGYAELPQHYPQPGWVEHDPEQIWQSVLVAAEAAVRAAGIAPRELLAIGIANQRETTLLWERATGRPVAAAIVWQDRRTAERCRELPAELLRERTGLVPDPYFSASKLEWLLHEHGCSKGLAFGTVDSWLVWKLTGGHVHVTDETNASRTLLASLETLDWDDELLELFDVPRDVLPEICLSSEVVGEGELLGATLPIAGIAGDQQAALFASGDAKATYGTGSFVLVESDGPAPHGLLRTAAARAAGEPPRYALEGSAFVTGAALQWLRDLGLLGDARESERHAASLDSNEGVYFVPALTGLGSPHWTPDARGLISGLTRATRREHLVRAALEAAAYQTRDVLEAMPKLQRLRADGGMTQNAWLMQFQADLLGIPVEIAAEREQTALGAALLGGLAVGFYEKRVTTPTSALFEPRMTKEEAERLYAGWREALRRTLL